MLFLPFVTADYIEGTGDWSILDEQIAFIELEPLGTEEHDRYAEAQVTEEKACLYDHCVRAIERAMKFGSRGLPLMRAVGMMVWIRSE